MQSWPHPHLSTLMGPGEASLGNSQEPPLKVAPGIPAAFQTCSQLPGLHLTWGLYLTEQINNSAPFACKLVWACNLTLPPPPHPVHPSPPLPSPSPPCLPTSTGIPQNPRLPRTFSVGTRQGFPRVGSNEFYAHSQVEEPDLEVNSGIYSNSDL